MSIYYCKKTRRQFIVGTGKSLLALPLLPSLLPTEVMAQSAQQTRRMLMVKMDHNNLNAMWPSPSQAVNPIGINGAKEVFLKSLGSMASHSPAFQNARYQSLMAADKLSIVRGFDLYHGSAHGNGPIAAGQDRNSGGVCPTIDSVIEASRTVYPIGTPSRVRRALRVNTQGGSIFYKKIGSNLQLLPVYAKGQIGNFYNEVFGSLTDGTTPPQDFKNDLKSNILSRVYSSYTSFRNGSKISADDRARVDQHMDYLSDLQRSFASVPPPVDPNCTKPQAPESGTYSDPIQYNGIYLDLLAIAFKCNLTKFAVFKPEAQDPQWIPNLGANGITMHTIMHGNHGVDLQLSVKINWWKYFADLVADRFLAKLEDIEGNTGRTYIDNMVTSFVTGGGFAVPGRDGGHNGLDTQQILIGSMGGLMRSGRYMTMPRSQSGNTPVVGNNIPYNRFLITMLQLMGVPKSEYEALSPSGQGFGFYGSYREDYPRKNLFYDPVDELLS